MPNTKDAPEAKPAEDAPAAEDDNTCSQGHKLGPNDSWSCPECVKELNTSEPKPEPYVNPICRERGHDWAPALGGGKVCRRRDALVPPK